MKSKDGKFELGGGASHKLYTDIEPCTVIEISNGGREVTVQYDKATLLNGADSGESDAITCTPGGFSGHMSGDQRWEIEPDKKGFISLFRLRKNGRWLNKGQDMNSPGGDLRPGRHKFYDFNF